jgi:hypothetical protein
MSNPWKTHRGDEWWYEAGRVRAVAGFGAGTASIEEVDGRGASLEAADLHRLLCSALENFDGARVVLDIGGSGVKAALASLEPTDLVKTTPIDAPFSKQVRVLSVRPLSKRP